MATDLERLVVSLEANIKKYERELNRSRGVTENALRDVERSVSASASRIESRMAQVGASIRAGIAGALAGISLRNVAELADSFTKVQNSLKVTGLQGDRLTSTYNQLFDLAQKQGAPLETLAGLYSRTAQSQKELNATSGDLITFTNAVATALRAGGVGAVQADQALTQLGQALGSGKVQWEELESIVDSAPTILQAAAAGIKEADGSVGKLNALVKDGKVSSEALFRAIIAGLPAVQALSDRTQETSSQGFARLNNALIDFVGKLDEATGASKSATLSVTNFAEGVRTLSGYIPGAVDLLKGLAEQAQRTATSFGNLPIFKTLAEKFADPKAVAELEASMNDVSALGQAAAKARAQAAKTGGVEGIDKLRDAFKARAASESKPAGKSGPGNMFDQVAEIDRKALAGKQISLDQFPVPGDKKDKKGKAGGGASKEKLNDYQKEIEAIEKRTRGFDNEREAVGKSAIEVAKAEASFRLLEAAKKANVPVTDELRAKVDTLSLAYANAKVQLDQAEERQQKFEAASRQTGAVLSDAFSDAIVNGEKLNVVVDRLIKSLASRGISSIFDSLFSKGGAGTNLLSGLFSGGGISLNPTGRAGGGPVYPGRAYTVGESGRETFVPTSPGRVIPARRTGGGRMVRMGDITINAPGADPAALMGLRAYVDQARAEDRRLIGQSLANWRENN